MHNFYRNLRLTLESKGYDDVDLGPDETKLQFTNTELISEQQKEINRLRAKLSETKADLDNVNLRVGRLFVKVLTRCQTVLLDILVSH